MIEEVCQRLQRLDGFAGLARADVRVDALQTLAHSEVYRLRVPSRSASFILKRSGAADLAGLAERERRFYRHIAHRLPERLVPGCVLIADDPAGWLLIEDLSATHAQSGDPLHPTLEHCRALVRALGCLHGFTRTRPAIRQRWHRIAADLPAATMEQRLDFFSVALGPFLQAHRDRLHPGVAALLSRVEGLPALLAAARQPPALVHGDAHPGNALYSPASSACLIDWGMPMLGPGEIDLAHALALNLPRRIARRWEHELVHAYRQQLAASGTDPDARSFKERYRLGVLYALTSPVVWWYSGVPESLWWPALSNTVDAAADLTLMS